MGRRGRRRAPARPPCSASRPGSCATPSPISPLRFCTPLKWRRCVQATKLNLFVVVMSLFLFMEAGMVVGTFQLGRKASEGGDSWYVDTELTDDMTSADALDAYSASFK